MDHGIGARFGGGGTDLRRECGNEGRMGKLLRPRPESKPRSGRRSRLQDNLKTKILVDTHQMATWPVGRQ